MYKGKWLLNRIFAFALVLMMLLTVPEVAAAAVLDTEAETTIVESTETNEEEKEEEDVIEGAVSGQVDDKEAASVFRTPISEVIELGTTETSAYSFSFFTETTDYVPLKSGNHVKWIDRIEVPDYALDLYDALVEGADNDGVNDILIDGTTAQLPIVEVTCPVGELADKQLEVATIIRAVYDAFDRDHPEVFWLSGDTYATVSGYQDDINAYITFSFALNTTISGEPFDIRFPQYSDAATLKTVIDARDAIVDTVMAEIDEGYTVVEAIRLFNAYLTITNEYCTTKPYPDASYECISALLGLEGANGPVCEGYARAFKVLCDNAGIPCVLVDGTAYNGVGREAHMWNYVEVGGVWYAVDVTWNDPTGGNGGPESGLENENWLLLGSDTEVMTGYTFIDTHPVSNCASIGGENFTNGPVLSKEAFVRIDFTPSISSQEVTYGYGAEAAPTVSVTGDSEILSKITYQWYKYVSDGTQLVPVAISGATNAAMPSGMDAGSYGVQLFYDGEALGYYMVTVNPKEITVTVSTLPKIYDGTVSTTIINYEIEGLIDGDNVGVTHETAAYADANAGTNKTITVTGLKLNGDDAGNYSLANTTATTVADIFPKDISAFTITLDSTSTIYTGKEITEGVVFYDSNLNPVNLVEGADYTITNNKKTAVGEYTLTVTGVGNYKGAVDKTWSIRFAIDNPNISYNGSLELKDWYTSDVVITVNLYKVSTSLDGEFVDSYTVSEEGVTDDLVLYFKNKDGQITDARPVGTIRIDKNAPADLSITVKDDVFRTFLNTITFGIFHIETQTGTVSATDSVSGLEGYYYYIDKSGSTTVKTSAELDQLTFTKGNNFSLAEDGNYVIYAYAVDNAGNKTGYVCTNGIVVDTTDPIIEVVQPTVDNGNLKDTSVTIVFTASEAGTYHLLSGTNPNASYSAEQIVTANSFKMVAGQNSFTINPLQPNTYNVVYIAIKDTAGNLSDVVTKIEFTTQKTLPTVTTNPTLSGTYGDLGVTLKVTPGVVTANGTVIEGTWSIPMTNENMDRPEVGTTKAYTVKFTPAEVDKYGEVTVQVVPTIAKKDITVTIRDAEKVFGTENPSFMADAPDEDMVSGDSMVADLGINRFTCEATKDSPVGTYVITTVPNSKNYNVIVEDGTLTITKAPAPSIAPIAKEYVYGLGSEGNVYIPLVSLLPENHGGVILSSSKVDENNIISTLSNGESEILYVVNNTGNAGDTATITVVAEMNNYENATITINIALVDKLTVSLKGGVTTVGSLTYGDALSKLTFGAASFEDTAGNPVAGTLTWDTPDAKLNAGTHEVAWTFTPSNTGKYKVVTGTVSVIVEKALPSYTVPTGLTAVYNPSATLAEVSLPTAENGVWTWKDASIVPTVENAGYTAVFAPTDSTNYKTVEATVAVNVTKATPVVTTPPTASDITYGDTLADSTLTGGTVDTQGTWAWKDATIAPVVADSNTTEYEVVFTPADTANYNTTTVKIKLVVEKAAWPAIVPVDEIAADFDCYVVGEVELPEGWEWAVADAETELGFEEEVEATAEYVGADKDNFTNITKVITITRNVDAPHIEGDEETMGWEAIADEMADTEKDEVRVDMNGHSVVSGDALETLRDENKTLVIVFTDEDGKEEYTWTIKGSDVEAGNVKALDMDVEIYAKDATDKPAIPETLVKDVVTGAKDHKFLSLSHDGEFGFKAALTINVGTANASKLATLYYYNETSNKLEETENVKIEVAKDGNIVLTFEHASDYVLVVNDKPTESGNGGATPTPDTGDGVFGNVYFYITLLLAGGLAGYVGVRKKREEQF